jgi:hypothetical protein
MFCKICCTLYKCFVVTRMLTSASIHSHTPSPPPVWSVWGSNMSLESLYIAFGRRVFTNTTKSRCDDNIKMHVKYGVKVCTGNILFSAEASGELLWTSNKCYRTTGEIFEQMNDFQLLSNNYALLNHTVGRQAVKYMALTDRSTGLQVMYCVRWHRIYQGLLYFQSVVFHAHT